MNAGDKVLITDTARNWIRMPATFVRASSNGVWVVFKGDTKPMRVPAASVALRRTA